MHKITIDGKTQNLAEWCLKLGLSYKMVCCRIHRGKWSIEQALELAPPPTAAINRIFNRIEVDPVTYCWEYTRGLNSDGYGCIDIHNKTFRVHRIMYEYIYGDIPADRPLILHRCDNRKCCNPMHLYAGTNRNNMDDMVSRNRSSRSIGENNGRSRLTDKKVIEIRESDEPQAVLAKRFNVNQGTIWHIKARKTWKHID